MPMGRSNLSSSSRIIAKRCGMILMRAMTEIQPEYVSTGLEQSCQDSGEELAGPSVAMILVRRRRRSFGRGAMRYPSGDQNGAESLTLVNVGPMRIASPIVVEQCVAVMGREHRARIKTLGARARECVRRAMRAAMSSIPSIPSVSPAIAQMFAASRPTPARATSRNSCCVLRDPQPS